MFSLAPGAVGGPWLQEPSLGHAVPIERLGDVSCTFRRSFQKEFCGIWFRQSLKQDLMATQSREVKMGCNPRAGSGIRLDLTGAGGRGVKAGLAMYICLRHCFVSELLLVMVFSGG